MYRLTVESEFSAAHHLVDYPGACKRVHGHNWKVRVTFSAPELNDLGMVVDLMELEKLLDECVKPLDHRVINEVPPFDRLNPTSENIARHIYQQLQPKLPAIHLESVQLFETDDFSVTYSPD